MTFRKKSEVLRREKVVEANKLRGRINRARKEAEAPGPALLGRRIVEPSLLAKTMVCPKCAIALSFRFVRRELQKGLDSEFRIQCNKCEEIYEVSTNSTVHSRKTLRPLSSINCKIAQGRLLPIVFVEHFWLCVIFLGYGHPNHCFLCSGCLDSGVGHEQVNKLLSAANLPIIHRNTMKLAESHVGEAVLSTAHESCREAIFEEKRLSVSDR